MLVVAELGVVRERGRGLVDADGVRHAGRPRVELVEFRFREHGALYLGNEFRKGAYVDADCVPASGHAQRLPIPNCSSSFALIAGTGLFWPPQLAASFCADGGGMIN